jgi:hypothetical protein
MEHLNLSVNYNLRLNKIQIMGIASLSDNSLRQLKVTLHGMWYAALGNVFHASPPPPSPGCI